MVISYSLSARAQTSSSSCLCSPRRVRASCSKAEALTPSLSPTSPTQYAIRCRRCAGVVAGVAGGGVGGQIGQPHRLGDGLGRRQRMVMALEGQAQVLGETPAARDPGAHAGVVGAEQGALVVDAGDGAGRDVQRALARDRREDRLAQVVQQPGQVPVSYTQLTQPNTDPV